MRTKIWIAMCVTVWSSSAAFAQLPALNPYGYPVYPSPPIAPYGPPAPGYPYALPPGLPTSPTAPSVPGGAQPPYGPGMPTLPGQMPNGQAMPMMPGAMPFGPMMMPNGQAMPMIPGAMPFGPMMMPNGQAMPPGAMPFGPMMMPNGQAMPPGAMPFGSAMMPPYGPTPPNPNALPTPIPRDPRLPAGQQPPASALPLQRDPGVRNLPTEPYYVQPDGSPTPPSGKNSKGPQMLPELKPGNVATEPLQRLIQFIVPSGPNEPYTTYEGRRYPAEARHDNTRVWAQASFMHWWIRRDNTPPLLTTGNPANPTAGVIGSPDTIVLLGDGAIGPREFSGVQATLGAWLDPDRLEALEVGGFWVGKNSRGYNFASDGNLPLSQPIQIGGAEAVNILAAPGVFSGSAAVRNVMDFHGLEMNFARNVLRVDGWTLDTLVGLRYLYMNDTLNMDQNLTVLAGGAGLVSFNGALQPAGSVFQFQDAFNITNRFYGGQIGARVNWACGRIDFGAAFKIAFGATAHVANIDGTTTLAGAGTAPGGTIAQLSNSGRTTSTAFSIVPEINANVGFQVTPTIRILAGYTWFDWNRVQRVGNQIDRQIDQVQVVSSPGFVPGAVGTRPVFGGTRTDFWAQGISVGLELKY